MTVKVVIINSGPGFPKDALIKQPGRPDIQISTGASAEFTLADGETLEIVEAATPTGPTVQGGGGPGEEGS
jgi:hypothetical protein